MRKRRRGIGCLTVFIILIVLGIIGGMIGGDNTTNNEGNTNNQNEKQENVVYNIGDTVKTDSVEFTVLDVQKEKTVNIDDAGYVSYTAEGNNIYYIVNFKLKNISDESINIDSSGFVLHDYNKDIDYSPSTLFTDDAVNISGFNPGTEVEKKLYYSIPEDCDFDNLKLISNNNIFSNTGDMEILLKEKE